MATVTYNSQSFAVDRRRVWVLGASIQYTRTPMEDWPEVIRAASQAGFNTIATACPWVVHEPRKGRFDFKEQADLRRFIELCHEQGMYVVLRVGPYIGEGFDGGGLPPWLTELPDIRLREANEVFMARTSSLYRRLVNEVGDLQVTQGGPILLCQCEDGWTATHTDQTDRYLREITRILKENGVSVPIINANDLWQDPHGTIDTWRGWDEMLLHVRQLRAVQPDAPRVVSAFRVAPMPTWGSSGNDERSAAQLQRNTAEILAAGGHLIVSPFHGGSNREFLGGQLSSPEGGFVTSAAALGAPLGEAGHRGEKYLALRRLIMFANHFSHVFADLDPEYHPVVLDPEESTTGSTAVSVAPLRGAQGRVVFLFSNGKAREITLALDGGVRLKVPLGVGGQLVSWILVDANIHGSGRLDYVNLCPVAVVDRSIVVLYGPERAAVNLSVNGNPLDATVPAGSKPLVVEHRDLTFVICNPKQIDTMYHDEETVFIGAAGLDAEGAPIAARSDGKVWQIRRGETPTQIAGARRARSSTAQRRSITDWSLAPTTGFVDGSSPRYASLGGPESLPNCGALHGYGWYRIKLRSNSAAKRLCHVPEAADRLHLFVDGEPFRLIGAAPGAQQGPFDLKLEKGERTLVALADNLGRVADGNDLGARVGLYGHLYEMKALRSIKPKIIETEPVDPFEIRGFVQDRAFGLGSSTRQAAWSFNHARRTPILVEALGDVPSGTWVLNGTTIAYTAGPTGTGVTRLMLIPGKTEGMRRKNELRFAPDEHTGKQAEAMAREVTLYEAATNLTGKAAWGFAKWQPPQASAFKPHAKSAAGGSGCPVWWRGQFTLAEDDLDVPCWVDTSGMSKGQVFVNGHNIGRYFTATRTGKSVGPQRRVFVPRSMLQGGDNELMLFDEHGAAPKSVKIVLSAKGELD